MLVVAARHGLAVILDLKARSIGIDLNRPYQQESDFLWQLRSKPLETYGFLSRNQRRYVELRLHGLGRHQATAVLNPNNTEAIPDAWVLDTMPSREAFYGNRTNSVEGFYYHERFGNVR